MSSPRWSLRTAPAWNGDLNFSKWGPNGDLILSEMGTKWGPSATEMGTKWGLSPHLVPIRSHRKFLKPVLLLQVIKWLTLDSGCTDFWRVLRPKMEKMGTLKKNGDQKTNFGPHGDQSPHLGTNVGAVLFWANINWYNRSKYKDF